MKFKLFYIAIFTVFLVSTVCFLPKKVEAKQNHVKITFCCDEKTFVYDQSKVVFDKNFKTNSALQRRGFFDDCLAKAKIAKQVLQMGFDECVATQYVLVGIGEVIDDVCRFACKTQTDSTIVFNPNNDNPFEITKEKNGICVDKQKLCRMVLEKLEKTNNFSITVPTKQLTAVSQESNVAKTKLKATFETNCANSNQNRKDNIALALSTFNGMVVEAGQKVSFNQVVGKRTEENGYKSAKVILNGKYVDGIGGGVCQASTTLYNAILLSGLPVSEWHRHTLKSNYVSPSLDAMVNDNGADLVFVNDTNEKIYIKTKCDGNTAKVWIYGVENEFDFYTKSVVTKQTKAEQKTLVDENGEYSDKVFYIDESFCLQNGSDGVESVSYIIATKNGKTVWQKLLRKDVYAKTDKIVVVGARQRGEIKTKTDIKAQTDTICQA